MKNESANERWARSELILRDELAIDRTNLANERTWLAYVRLAITLMIAGISIVHFAMERWFETVGFLCVPIGLGTGIYGWRRFKKKQTALAAMGKVGSRKKNRKTGLE